MTRTEKAFVLSNLEAIKAALRELRYGSLVMKLDEIIAILKDA